jgi:hypothetical protein
MTLPLRLQTIVEAALRAMRNHPEHNLAPDYRHLIYYRGLCWPEDDPHTNTPAGLAGYPTGAQTLLNILTTRRVLPIWEAEMPQDRFPHRLLAEAEQMLRGEVDTEQVDDHIAQGFDYIEEELQTRDAAASTAIGVGYAALYTLITASGEGLCRRRREEPEPSTAGTAGAPDQEQEEEPLSPESSMMRERLLSMKPQYAKDLSEIDDQRDDSDFYYRDHDVAFWAMSTFAYYPYYAIGDHVEGYLHPVIRRKVFWDWWLMVALPSAWETAITTRPLG